jgi:hypothetical protein
MDNSLKREAAMGCYGVAETLFETRAGSCRCQGLHCFLG